MPNTETIRIAAAQYDISFLRDWHEYENKIGRWVDQAACNGAQLLLFPEYGSMELASLFSKEVQRSLGKQLESMQTLLERFSGLFRSLSAHYNVYIQAGTFPVKLEDGSFRNRAFLFDPEGHAPYQDKLQMTRFENEQWFIRSGSDIQIFETRFGRVGINVCYDSEFPLIARKQVEAGANLILVPSCTDTLAGYNRVRIGCQARALENQCYVVQSPTVGEALWSEAVDINIGAAAIYTPVDYGFPDDGVLAMGELNKAQWVFADLALKKIETVREEGQVFNYRDWPGQFRFQETTARNS